MEYKIWVDGLRVYKPDERAPDFVKANIVINNGAHRWPSVAAQLPGRASKQCRER